MTMSMDIEKLARWAVTCIAVAFSVFFFLEARFWLRDEAAAMAAEHDREIAELERQLAASEERLTNDRLMADSTRYAEVAHHYQNKMANGEDLSEADKARLELVQRQQLRIHQTLTKDD